MEDRGNPNSRAGWSGVIWPWLVVLAVLLFVGCLRVRMLHVPLERDEGEYAYAGQLILQGIPPYELAYNMKLPGTYYAYALGMAVFGQTPAGVHLTLLVVNSLTGIFIFLLGRKLFGVTAGLVACATFALMSVSEAVLGLAGHATQFVVLPAVAATWLLWCATEERKRLLLFFSGLGFGLAFLMKQPGIFFGLGGLIFLVARAFRQRPVWTRAFAGDLAAFGGAMAMPFLFFCFTTVVAGDFGQFWFWTFDYAGTYAGERSFSNGMQVLGSYIGTEFPVFGGFGLLAIAGLLAGIVKPKFRREFIFATAFLFFSFLGTTPGLYFRQHYFVLVLPAIALLVGMAVFFLQEIFSSRARFVPVLMFVGIAGVSVYEQRMLLFRATPQTLCEYIYQGNPLAESALVAQYIREHSAPDARVAVIGSEPEIYFYAHRHSATGYIYTYPMMEPQPYAERMEHEMIGEIEAAKPEFIVLVMYKFSWLMDKNSDLGIWQWTEDYTRKLYQPVGVAGQRPDGELFWVTDKPENKQQRPSGEFMILYQLKPSAT